MTVLTPTYNRAPLLPRLYDSLCRQTFRDFEWLVVDDGSTDNTSQLLVEWARVAPFRLRWEEKPNGGKHTALNVGYRIIETPFTAMMDSDAWYTDDGLSVLMRHWDAIPEHDRHRFASVEGAAVLPDGGRITTPFPGDVFDSDTFTVRVVHGVKGDTIGIHRSDVLAAHPFPEYEGFITEGLIWNRIASRYKTRFINDVVGYTEYQRGGLSDWEPSHLISAAKGFQQLNHELLTTPLPLPFKHRLKAYANFVRYSCHAGLSLRGQARQAPSKMLWLSTAPLGIALAKNDQRRARRTTPPQEAEPKT